MTSSSPRTKAFISYSHNDERYLKELKVHLGYYERLGLIQYWDDTRIAKGAVWRDEIDKALRETKVGVLLVSADFLNSRFVTEKEIPDLLKAAKDEGAIILCVILRHCVFSDTPLEQFQALNNPSKPLSDVRKSKREALWTELTQTIRDFLGKTEGASDGGPLRRASSATLSRSEQTRRKDGDRERKITDVLSQDKELSAEAMMWSKYAVGDTEEGRRALQQTQALLRQNPFFVRTFGPAYYMDDDDTYWTWWEFAVFDGQSWHSFHLDADLYPSLESGRAPGSGPGTREAVADLVYREFKKAVDDFNRADTRYIRI